MKNIFLVIWGDPKFYQTLIFLSKKFSSDKFKVSILCRNTDNTKDIIGKVNFGKNTKLLKHPIFLSYNFNILNYIIFNFYIISQIFLNKPDYVIFFNHKSLFNVLFIKMLKKKINCIYHNFDFELTDNVKSFKERFLIILEYFCTKFCNHLIFPSKERMLIFKKFSKNKISKYHSFMNCFSKNFTIKNSINFNKFLYKNNLKSKYIVCYLGSIGSNHHLEEIIDSFKLLNDNFVLVVAGSSISGFADKLKNKVINENLQKKVFIFKDVSNKYWFEILKRSQLGLCFYKQNFSSHKFMAGTSQKFNNYVFSNTPMIVNNNNDFLSFKKKFDIFDVVNPNDPKKIASKINFLLTNKARYYKIKKNLKISFLQDLNFEKQYEKSYKTFL